MNQNRLYNSRLFDSFLKLLEANYPRVNITLLLRDVGIEPYEIADQGRWFTDEQINKFYKEVIEVTGNEQIAREAGRFCSHPDTLGAMRQFILSMLNPAKAFESGNTLSEFLTKSADLHAKTLSPNSVEIIVTPRDKIKEQPFLCQYRMGFFEAIVTIFDFALPKIVHDHCIFQNKRSCRYIIKWPRKTTGKLKVTRDLYAASAVSLNMATAIYTPGGIETVLPTSVAGLLGLNWWLANTRKQVHERTLGQLRDSMEQLNEQINLNYRNSHLSRVIGEVITSQTCIDEVIDAITEALQKMLDYDRGLVLLANKDDQRLEIRGAFGYSQEHISLLETTTFSLNNPNSQGPFTTAFRERKPLLINDISSIADQITHKSKLFIRNLGTKSFATVPIMLDYQSIGLLAVDNYQRKKPLVNSDVNLLMGIAPTIGVSFRNAMLNEARERQFAATLQVLAHSIDARDFLTSGHSEQVAEYAVGIAEALGQSHEYCQMIQIAALLHDYGKIGVPDTVLKKDGPLTDTERALIRTHSQQSYDILSQVPFEGLYAQIPEICLYHHERLDGTGYPRGLKDGEIPFGAKIIAVADFYEAVTSKRHYREPMPDHVAVSLLKKDSGTHFDPEIVEAFLLYLNGKPEKTKGKDASTPQGMIQPKLREPRYDFKAPVYAKIAKMSTGGKTIDISSGGVFLQIPSEIAEKVMRHQTLEIMLDLPNANNVEFIGEARWHNLPEARSATRLPVGVGIAFKYADQTTRKLLDETIRILKNKHESDWPFRELTL